MTSVILKTATHIYAQPGEVTVTEAEASRLCALGVAELKADTTPEPAETPTPEPAEAPTPEPKKKTTKKAAK
jgi:hypothetical protein